MNEPEGLDLTSESPAPVPPPAQPAAGRLSSTSTVAAQPEASAARPLNAVKVLFRCCRVYAVVHVPEGVLNGQLSSWRFHCPRCGRLNEIPL